MGWRDDLADGIAKALRDGEWDPDTPQMVAAMRRLGLRTREIAVPAPGPDGPTRFVEFDPAEMRRLTNAVNRAAFSGAPAGTLRLCSHSYEVGEGGVLRFVLRETSWNAFPGPAGMVPRAIYPEADFDSLPIRDVAAVPAEAETWRDRPALL